MPTPGRADIEPNVEPSDEEIVRSVLSGNKEEFARLITRHNQQLYRVGRAYLRDHDGVEDAMQNAYIKAFQNLSRFRRGSAFSTWLTRIMINECLMALRRERTRREDRVDDQVLDRIPALVEPAAELTQLKEMKALLENAVAQLPLAYRTVYVLREVQNLSTSETARCLGISTVSAKVKLHRARTMIKDRLLADTAGSELFAYNARFCTRMTERVMTRIREL